jgi:S-formylglutathione hydrolase FrmB
MISEAVTHKSWRRFARRGGIALALATAVVAGTVVSVPIARAALSQPPAAVCANGAGLQPVLGCPPPAYVGDDNSEGECGGASGQPAFIDNSTTDPFHRLVRVKLDAGGYFPAPTKGTNVNVLLPRDYASSARRYPVLYMFAGGSTNQDSWLSATDLLAFTNQYVGDQAAIVVLVASSDSGIDLDWRNGRWLWESVEVKRLIPYIDAHFRTIADRAHRAVAGDSAGGFTAMHLAARHPDMFIAAASFSGFLDFTLDSPATEAAFFPIEREEDLCGGGQPGDAGLAGDPVMSDIWWHNLNPTDLASNLRGLTLFITSGNGVPCGSGDVTPQFNPYPWDTLTYPMSREFSAALTRAGIPHIADFYGCGTHLWSYWQPELHRFWSMLLAAFGRKPPASFDYRTADSPQHSVGLVDNSAYGWTFAPDPARAPEFLDARTVSKRGLTLVGSGQTTVTTAPLFAAGESVRVSGAGGPAKVAIANTAGQITFSVDLGPPHTAQEYTPQALAAGEDRPGHFTTRTVTFTPAGSALGRGIERVASRCARLRDHRSYTRTRRSTGATTGSCRHHQRIGRRQH